MKKGNTKRAFAFLLAGTMSMASSVVYAQEEDREWPEYLNMESTYPVIKEDAEPIKLTGVFRTEAAVEWDNLWVSKFLKDKYNVDLDMECIVASAAKERKNLMLNSGELPDLMWNFQFTTEELVRYGSQEGLLLALDEYISEELTPNLYKYMNEVKQYITAPDGHIYTLPYVFDEIENALQFNRIFINGEYLEAAGIESPKTLDEFTDAMYKLKEADVTGVGSENFYPIGGGMDTRSAAPYLLRAFGYVTDLDSYGLKPAVRNGEAVLPAYDLDTYQEFLKLMNQYYKDGIINPNYFTIENTESDAQLQTGNTAVCGTVVYTTGLENWKDWDSLYPLTSEWNDTPIAYDVTPVEVGGFVISADTEYPELCMRLADIFYDETDNRAFWGGTGEGSEYDSDDYVLNEWIPEKNNWTVNTAKLPEGVSGYTNMIENLHGAMLKFGSYTQRQAIVNMAKANGGDLPFDVRETYDPENTADHQWRAEMWDKVMDYRTYGYPRIYYVDEEISNEIIDLRTVIEPYVKEQVALFITGGRDLSEIDDYKKELDAIGMGRLQEIYQEIYNNMK